MNVASIRSSVERVPALVVDTLLTLVVAVAISMAIAVAPEPGARSPDALAYGLGVAIAALLLIRRRFPLAVLIGSVLILQVYYALGYPGFFPGVPLAAALYTAATRGRLGWSLGLSAMWVVGPLIYRLAVDPEPLLRVLNDTVRDGGFLLAVMLLAIAVRSRRAYTAEVADRLRRAEAERERVAQELKVAHLVQQEFLPHELPDLPGWRIAAFYRSAREVGGDFYNVTELAGSEIGVAIGDVTDKGAPAALLMATTQGLLRADTSHLRSPGALLGRVNDVLVPNVPDKMFVTCSYILLDTATGGLRLANAGHPLPYVAAVGEVLELRAKGMPLGLLPGMSYEEREATLSPGATLVLHSDGLAEAHSPDGEMFGLPRLVKVIENSLQEEDLIGALLAELDRFTGPGWEQEDDITLVTLQRSGRVVA
jgi:serine phosphatase RsbU (regulator of sigma subunit)